MFAPEKVSTLDDSTPVESVEVRHRSERATLTFQKKVRANLHRPVLGDSRTLTLEEVRRRDE